MKSKYNHPVILPLLLIIVMLLGGCSPRLYDQPTYESDDLYSIHDPKQIIANQIADSIAKAKLREQRMNEWAQALGYQTESEIVDISAYQTPYGEKLLALSADSYQRPSSYYNLERQQQTLANLSNYDPSEYNAYVDNSGNVVLSPKYYSSMYGTWNAPINSAWVYGYPSYRYSWGYYPSYGWYDWNYGYGYPYYAYNPYWGYSPYYYDYGYYYRPRPPYYTNNSSYRKRTIVRPASPYVAPSSTVGTGRRTTNSNGSSVGRSSGGSYNRGGSSRSNSYSSPSSTTRSYNTTPTFSRPSSGSSGGRSTNAIGR